MRLPRRSGCRISRYSPHLIGNDPGPVHYAMFRDGTPYQALTAAAA